MDTAGPPIVLRASGRLHKSIMYLKSTTYYLSSPVRRPAEWYSLKKLCSSPRRCAASSHGCGGGRGAGGAKLGTKLPTESRHQACKDHHTRDGQQDGDVRRRGGVGGGGLCEVERSGQYRACTHSWSRNVKMGTWNNLIILVESPIIFLGFSSTITPPYHFMFRFS